MEGPLRACVDRRPRHPHAHDRVAGPPGRLRHVGRPPRSATSGVGGTGDGVAVERGGLGAGRDGPSVRRGGDRRHIDRAARPQVGRLPEPWREAMRLAGDGKPCGGSPPRRRGAPRLVARCRPRARPSDHVRFDGPRSLPSSFPRSSSGARRDPSSTRSRSPRCAQPTTSRTAAACGSAACESDRSVRCFPTSGPVDSPLTGSAHRHRRVRSGVIRG